MQPNRRIYKERMSQIMESNIDTTDYITPLIGSRVIIHLILQLENYDLLQLTSTSRKFNSIRNDSSYWIQWFSKTRYCNINNIRNGFDKLLSYYKHEKWTVMSIVVRDCPSRCRGKCRRFCDLKGEYVSSYNIASSPRKIKLGPWGRCGSYSVNKCERCKATQLPYIVHETKIDDYKDEYVRISPNSNHYYNPAIAAIFEMSDNEKPILKGISDGWTSQHYPSGQLSCNIYYPTDIQISIMKDRFGIEFDPS